MNIFSKSTRFRIVKGKKNPVAFGLNLIQIPNHEMKKNARTFRDAYFMGGLKCLRIVISFRFPAKTLSTCGHKIIRTKQTHDFVA